jgi:hypothetical protein
MFTSVGRRRMYLILSLVILLSAPILPLHAEQSVPTTPPRADALEITSRLDGKVSALARAGQYVYAGIGTSLVVLNWFDGAHPVRLGSVSLTGRVADVQLVGTVAYLAVETQGLVTVDVSDPAQPKLLGTFLPETEGASTGLVIVGTYAYLLHQGAVLILDVAIPSQPVYRATLFSERYNSADMQPPHILDIAGSASYLYLVWSRPNLTDPGFEVVSLAKPAAPTSLGRCCDAWTFSDLDLFFKGLAVEGTKAYVLDHNGVHTIDLTAPTAPHIAGYTSIHWMLQSLAVANDYAFVLHSSLDGGSQYIEIVDSAGIQVATYTRPEQGQPVDDIVAVGDSLYLIGAHGIERLRIAAPDRLTPVGRYKTLGELWDVAVEGRYVYSVGRSGFAVIDIAVPEAPQIITATNIITGYTLGVYNGHAYIRHDHEVQIIDITDSSYPVNVGTYAIEGALGPIGFREHYAYLVSNKGIEILDIAVPAVPRGVGVYKPDAYTTDFQIVGQYGYVAQQSLPSGSGFTILDLSDPASPRVVGTYTDPDLYNPPALAVAEHYVYLMADRQGNLPPTTLQVIDIADPARPHEVSRVVLPNEVPGYDGVLVQENYAYVPTASGLFLIDVTDPVHSALVGVNYEANTNTKLVAGQTVIYGAGGTLYTLRNQLQGLRGRVVDVHGAAVDSVVVNSGRAGSAVTDGRGRYALHHLARGSYTLEPTRPGYTFIPPRLTADVPADALDEQRFVMFSAPVSLTLTPGVSATLRYTDTQGLVAKWEFPSTAVTTHTTVVVEPQLPVAWVAMVVAGHAWGLRGSRGGALLPDFRFAAPVKVTVTYSDQDIWVVTDERQLWLAQQATPGWKDATEQCAGQPAYTRDVHANTLVGTLCTTGLFALMGPTHQVYLPRISR